MHEVHKICYFYAEIVKFGLILTHIICGKTGGGEKIFGRANTPMAPYGPHTTHL